MMLSLLLFSVLFGHPIFLNISLFCLFTFPKLSYGADFSMYCKFTHSFSTWVAFALIFSKWIFTLCVYSHLLLSSLKSLILKNSSCFTESPFLFLLSRWGGKLTFAHNKQWSLSNSMLLQTLNALYYLWRFQICYKIFNNWSVPSSFPTKFMDIFMLKEMCSIFLNYYICKNLTFFYLCYSMQLLHLHPLC